MVSMVLGDYLVIVSRVQGYLVMVSRVQGYLVMVSKVQIAGSAAANVKNQILYSRFIYKQEPLCYSGSIKTGQRPERKKT